MRIEATGLRQGMTARAIATQMRELIGKLARERSRESPTADPACVETITVPQIYRDALAWVGADAKALRLRVVAVTARAADRAFCANSVSRHRAASPLASRYLGCSVHHRVAEV
ncbi:MAG TPA: hypothetical protein VJS66_02670 [Burkholderiales bacterium]|nr:hypothetical protein [Burkholderiales bacterium]